MNTSCYRGFTAVLPGFTRCDSVPPCATILAGELSVILLALRTPYHSNYVIYVDSAAALPSIGNTSKFSSFGFTHICMFDFMSQKWPRSYYVHSLVEGSERADEAIKAAALRPALDRPFPWKDLLFPSIRSVV